MARVIQEIITWFDANGNPTRVGFKVVVIRRHIEFGDGTVEIEEFIVEDKVEKSLQGGEEDDFPFPLPQDIESQLPVIPDEVFDNEDAIEKGLKGIAVLVSRVLRVFRGRKGLWFTRQGKKVFIDVDKLPPILRPEGVSVKLSGISSGGANKLLRKLKINVSDIADGFSFDHKGFKTSNLNININKFGPSSEPSQIVITGKIINSEGLVVGNFLRSILPNAKQAVHASIRLDKKFQGNGISGAFNKNKFKFYRNIGLKEVSLVTDEIGKYAWAVQGFDFQTIGTALIFQKKFTKFLIKQTGRKDIPWEKAVGNFKHPWDFARFRWNGRKLGKEFLINNVPNWKGTFDLNSNSNSSRIFNEFIKRTES